MCVCVCVCALCMLCVCVCALCMCGCSVQAPAGSCGLLFPPDMDPDIEALEKDVKKKLLLHPSLSPFLNKHFFVKYSGLLTLHQRQPHMSQALTCIHRMTAPRRNPPDELFCSSEADNTRTAAEIIQYEFCRRNNVFAKENEKKKICDSLASSLVDDGLGQDRISEILHSFDTNATGEEFRRAYVNCHVYKALGFPNSKAFHVAIADMKKRGEKKIVIDITARFLLTLLKHNDGLTNDAPRDNFVKNVHRYNARAGDFDYGKKFLSRIGLKGVATLSTIRDNSIINCKSFIQSEVLGRKNYCSLELYAQREQFPKLEYTCRQMEKVNRIVTQNDSKTISFNRSNHDIGLKYNCWICPSSRVFIEDENSNESGVDETYGPGDREHVDTAKFPITLRDRVMSAFNVQRLAFYGSKSAADEHFKLCHSALTPTQLAGLNGHHNIIWCPLCDEDQVEIACVCCTSHLSDHHRYLVDFFAFSYLSFFSFFLSFFLSCFISFFSFFLSFFFFFFFSFISKSCKKINIHVSADFSFFPRFIDLFLVACTRLYKPVLPVCRSIRRPVDP